MAAAFRKYGLETGIWGFQADTGLHGLRLTCAGVFDRFPGLRIVLGHLGEGLPYWPERDPGDVASRELLNIDLPGERVIQGLGAFSVSFVVMVGDSCIFFMSFRAPR